VKAAARTPGLEKRPYRGGKTQEDLKPPPKPQETPCRNPNSRRQYKFSANLHLSLFKPPQFL